MGTYRDPDALALAADLEARLVADTDLVADEQAGDLATDGRQVIRVGTIVRVATFDGWGAIDHADETQARAAFAAMRP